MQTPKKVLYIDGVGPFGGASRSLFEAVARLKKNNAVTPYFLNSRGTANDYYATIAEDTTLTQGLSRFDNTRYSHYRGLRWLVLAREVFHLPFTIAAIFKSKKKWDHFDLVHINEITEIIPGLIASRIFKCPLIVHVRSLQSEKKNLRTAWINKALKKSAGIVCIDETVSRTIPENINKTVIHNSFTIESDKKDKKIEEKLKIHGNKFRVGFVGNLQEIKGIIELAQASAILKNREDIVFLIVGDDTEKKSFFRKVAEKLLGLSQDTKERIIRIIEENKIQDKFILLGRTGDISTAYKNFDVLCFPSHLDAPGRPVFESAFFQIPSIVCVESPTPDTVIPGKTALTIPEKNPEALANAILYLADSPEDRNEMGQNAYQLALSNFDPERNSQKLQLFYNSVLLERS
ncbi:glycosyltransferase family 4 protein [Alcaligenes nematophilus]|uniref:glycosyltransferase family 4 protein n=1 Tax=Alcaligenes nematophilus TaxID=2994643 RepID=UPI0034E0A57E